MATAHERIEKDRVEICGECERHQPNLVEQLKPDLPDFLGGEGGVALCCPFKRLGHGVEHDRPGQDLRQPLPRALLNDPWLHASNAVQEPLPSELHHEVIGAVESVLRLTAAMP